MLGKKIWALGLWLKEKNRADYDGTVLSTESRKSSDPSVSMCWARSRKRLLAV